MNWAHLKAFVWLRWRLVANRTRKAGSASVVVGGLLTLLMAVGSLAALVIGFLLGALALARASSLVVMLFWDGAVVGFLLFWLTGLMAELQRSEALSLDRFLHLPVSPTGAFLINYLGSSVSIGLLLFGPGMTGLSLGLIVSRGVGMLALFPLVAAFFLMVTAVTYQFRGWLASMMTNPRRRRRVLTLLSVGFMAVFMLPQLASMNRGREAREARTEARATREALDRQLANGEITQDQYESRVPVAPRRGLSEESQQTARLINTLAPPGWLPYGAAAAIEGRSWPALAATMGMALIGAMSLMRSYRTTIRMYAGVFRASGSSGAIRGAAAEPLASTGEIARRRSRAAFLEKRLPGIPERASAIAMASLRSMIRAHETKMILLSPAIMVIVFGGMFGRRAFSGPGILAPLSAIGLTAFVLLFGLVGLSGNLFGFDRHGFRAYVLAPASGRDVLLGKNLSVFPLVLGLGTIAAGLSQWMNPMRLDHLAGVLVQDLTLFLVLSLAGNMLSILAPMVIKPGSGMPAGQQVIKVLYQMGFMILLPLLLTLTLVPLGIEVLLQLLEWQTWFPAFLVLGIAQAAFVAWLYSLILDWQGELLYRREQQILEVVTTRAE